MTINEDSSVQILAEEAHKVEDLDVSAARWVENLLAFMDYRIFQIFEWPGTVTVFSNIRMTGYRIFKIFEWPVKYEKTNENEKR